MQWLIQVGCSRWRWLSGQSCTFSRDVSAVINHLWGSPWVGILISVSQMFTTAMNFKTCIVATYVQHKIIHNIKLSVQTLWHAFSPCTLSTQSYVWSASTSPHFPRSVAIASATFLFQCHGRECMTLSSYCSLSRWGHGLAAHSHLRELVSREFGRNLSLPMTLKSSSNSCWEDPISERFLSHPKTAPPSWRLSIQTHEPVGDIYIQTITSIN